jgi:PAS domain S-box-containing protein
MNLPEGRDWDLFDASPFPAVLSRLADDTIIALNRTAADLVPSPSQEIIGRPVTDFYVDSAVRAALVEQVRRDGRTEDVLLQLALPGGRPMWARASSRLVTVNGEPAMLSVFNDVTKQIVAEQTLRASEQRLVEQSEALTELTEFQACAGPSFAARLPVLLETAARTLHAARVSMWRFEAAGDGLRCMDLYEEASRRHDSGQLLLRGDCGEYFAALEHERVIAARDAYTDPRTRAFGSSYLPQHGIGAMLDVPLRTRDTTIGVLCVEHVGHARTWTVDERNFAVSVANLITVAIADDEREEAVRRLAESEARSRLVLDTAHDAFIGADSEGRIVDWNAQAAAIFGWSLAEVEGHRLSDTIIPEPFREAHDRGLERFLATGDAPMLNQRLELRALHRDGREFPIEITITNPIRSGHGYFFGAFLRDISDRRRHEEELRRAKEAAEGAARAKSEFLANMSHELRTPLNGVLGYAQLLQRDQNLGPQQREALDAITTCGAHLLDLINDVLDLSRIEARRTDDEPTVTDLRQIGADLEQVMADAARRKNLQLFVRVAPEVPSRVLIDGRHLRQVLVNLLGNAVKFTSEGHVRLSIERVGDGSLRFEVADTGIGIEPDDLDAIFEAFGQTDAGSREGGTGLGLTISERLVRTMKGQLRVESVLGEGSCFFFTLPLIAAPDRHVPADLDEPSALTVDARLAPGVQLTALVADDNVVNRRVLASLLEAAGARVVTAQGGIEAVELAERVRPDVVLMDRRMADLDGFEATRRIHANPATARMPVLAVTASAFGEVREAAAQAGCIDFIPKPIRAEVLFGKLRQHLGVQFVTGPRGVPPRPSPPLRAAQTPGLGEELRKAAELGDVTALDAIARGLALAAGPAAALGDRIASLTASFDFDGVLLLAEALDREEQTHAGH